MASLIAIQVAAWWELEGIRVLPNATLHCMGQTCTETSQAWMGAGELWLRTGTAVTTATYLVALGGVALAAAAAANKTSILLARWTFASVAVAAVATGILMSRAPALLGGHLTWGGVLLLVACALACAAGILSHRTAPAVSPARQSL